MAGNLQQYFPMLRSRQQVEAEIQGKENLKRLFGQWNEAQQKEFLDFCSGARGTKMLYDSFFKAVLNPDTKPERLERLLSLILGQEVRILMILPNESSRIADEGSLLIMDIVVRLVDGSIANIECQKIGYAFPGQRAACYSADLLMRQYRRIKAEKGKSFSYRDIKKVYTIIFYEKSPKEFQRFPGNYIHCSRQRTDTGVQLELLQEFVFIPLDIYFKYHHNKGIRNELEAWLTFLGSDRPEDIVALIEHYPQFRELYEDVYDLCLNTERVMEMFSKELKELDRNTVRYMIDEMQTEMDAQAATIDEQTATINEQTVTINEQTVTINEQTATINEQTEKLADKEAEVERLKKRIAELEQK